MPRQVGNNGRGKATVPARDVTKAAEILKLVASGCTVTEAAKRVGVSRKHASHLYQRELQTVVDGNSDLRQLLIAQDLETLRLLAKAHMGPALGELVVIDPDGVITDDDGTEQLAGRLALRTAPDAQSAKIVLAVLDRRAKLLGLDATIKVEISQQRINDIVDAVVALVDGADDEEIAAVLPIESGRRDAG
jgi:hypothetical protein